MLSQYLINFLEVSQTLKWADEPIRSCSIIQNVKVEITDLLNYSELKIYKTALTEVFGSSIF